MSFGFSVGDFVTISALAWNVYKSCKDSCDEFKNISGEVVGLHIVLLETKDYLSEHGESLSKTQISHLNTLAQGCNDVLLDLETLLGKYNRLGSKTQRTWERLKWGLEDISALRDRLVSQTLLLTAFNTNMTSSSLARLEQKLNAFMAEIREGKREGSIITTQSGILIDLDLNEAWTQLRRELEDVGLPMAATTEHKDYIISWFREVAATAALEDAVDPLSGEKDTNSASDDEEANLVCNGDNLLQAVKDGRLQFVKKFIAAGKDVHYCDPNTGENAIQIAAEYGQVDIGELLIMAGIEIDAKCSKYGNTALHKAAVYGQAGFVKLLLKKKATVDQLNEMGRTPLCLAVQTGGEHICEALLVSGADPNFCDVFALDFPDPRTGEYTGTRSLLHKAAYYDLKEILKLLLDHGADLSATNTFGCTALHGAAVFGRTSCVSLFVKRGADINQKSIDHQRTALHFAARHGKERTVNLLLDLGANPSAGDKIGCTALHVAAEYGKAPCVLTLLRHGVDIDERDDAQWTALHFAAHHGKEDVMDRLLDHGANKSARDRVGCTPLHIAARQGNKSCVSLLLRRGVDINQRIVHGQLTALHLAAYKGRLGMVLELLDKGAKVNAKTTSGRTPLDEAKEAGEKEVVKTLVEAGGSGGGRVKFSCF